MASKQEGTTHIGIHHGIIVINACPDEVGIPANPGSIDQDIQAAQLLDHGLNGTYGCLLLTCVARDDRTSPAMLLCLVSQRLQPFRPARHNNEICALVEKYASDRQTDARTSSCDQRHLPHQLSFSRYCHDLSPMSMMALMKLNKIGDIASPSWNEKGCSPHQQGLAASY
jgi:hypothetical protein